MNKTNILLGLIIFVFVISAALIFSFNIVSKDVNSKKESSVSKNSLYLVEENDDKYVYVNTDGKIVTIEGYDIFGKFEHGTALARKKGSEKDCIINNKGNVIVPEDKYDYIEDLSSFIRSRKCD